VTQSVPCQAGAVTGLGLRERKKRTTSEALVRSAMAQFATRGFERVTVEEIAGACDVSPRTFFRYFASKEDVLFADGDAQRAHIIDTLAAQPADVSPLDAMRAAVCELAADFEARREAVLLRHRLVAGTPSLRSHVADRHHGWERAVIEELRGSGRADGMGELSLRLLVAATTSALRVSIDLWAERGAGGDLRSLVTDALDQLGSGLDGSPGREHAAPSGRSGAGPVAGSG
jgi:AcrR family transcriptional regulator